MQWWPALKCRWRKTSCPFSEAEYILARNAYNQVEILAVHANNKQVSKKEISFRMLILMLFFVFSTNTLNIVTPPSSWIEKVAVSSRLPTWKQKIFHSQRGASFSGQI